MLKTVLALILAVSLAVSVVANDNDRRYLNFFPHFKASVRPVGGGLQSWNASCFRENTAHLTHFDGDGATLQITASNPKSLLCSDLYLIATAESIHFALVAIRGTHRVQFRKWKHESEKQYVADYGVQVFTIDGGVIGFARDVIATYEMFFGSKQRSMKDQLDFLREYMNITMVPKPAEVPVKLFPDEDELLSGDCLQMYKFGGVHGGEHAIQAYGTGGRSDHVAALLRIDGMLYVVESMGGGGTGGINGIIKTPYKQWVRDVEPEWMVALLRLSDEARSRFDEAAAVAFFQSVAGSPYGYHNYFFGWVDTEEDNFPPPLSAELMPIVFAVLDRVKPALSRQMWGEALNKRLGTSGLDIVGIIEQCERRNISFYKLLTIPERDDWRYSDGVSLTCSSLVMAIYKAAGVFEGIDFEASELTPRDTYSLAIYAGQGQWKQPAACALDPNNALNGGYCQFSGTFRFDLPEFNSILPYDHMFELCGGLPLDYRRSPGC